MSVYNNYERENLCHYLQEVECVLHIQVSAGDESRMAGDGDVLYGRRRRCLVWPEMTVDSDTG